MNEYNREGKLTKWEMNVPTAWYSYSYCDLVVKDKKVPYGNTHNTILGLSRTLGSRYYELPDHLGNVLATVLDRRTAVLMMRRDGGKAIDYYKADVVSASDYYPGGMLMPGRFKEYTWSRMGSQSQQKDDELYGKGNMYAFKYRMNDTRINRFWSPDPLHGEYPWNSDYAFSENRLTDGVELEGLEYQNATTGEGLGPLNSNLTESSSGVFTENYSSSIGFGSEIEGVTVVGKKNNNSNVDAALGNFKNELHFNANSTLSMENNYNIKDAENGLRTIYSNYGKDMAVNIERMYRIETNHFRSKQYRRTGTGGMEAFGDPPNYGWNMNYLKDHPEYTPTGIFSIFEGVGLSANGGNAQIKNKTKSFIIMPSVEAGMVFKAEYILRYNGNYARWFSTDLKKQKLYRETLQQIKPKIVNKLDEK